MGGRGPARLRGSGPRVPGALTPRGGPDVCALLRRDDPAAAPLRAALLRRGRRAHALTLHLQPRPHAHGGAPQDRRADPAARAAAGAGSAEQMQLVLIVSDGRRSPSWGDPSLWIRRAAQQHILLCFVIVDAAASEDSIMDLQSVSYPDGKLTISKWIDSFPFPYYIVLRDLVTLPQVLSDALRQWLELLQRT